MSMFTDFEKAVLLSIGSETPWLAAALERQVAGAVVTGRKNTGAGFFTAISVPRSLPPVSGPCVLGLETHARVAGLRDAMGFVLFLKEGWLDVLEGYVWGGESTASLDFDRLAFEVFRAPVTRVR